MKKLIPTSVLLLLSAFAAGAQGTVVFTTINGTDLRAPVYGPETGDVAVAKSGNTSEGIPVGAQIYSGVRLAGSGYTAQLWAANGAGQAESSLVACPGATTSFRTGTAAGYVVFMTGTLTGVPKDALAATLQLRVWDNQGGTLPTWASTFGTGVNRGMSAPFDVLAIGGDINTPPLLTGLRSFNIWWIPEPNTPLLFGLGVFVLWLSGRRRSTT